MKTLILIDGNHMIHRAYWAIQNLKMKNGTPTGAVFGFFSMILTALHEYDPDYFIVCFDSKEKTFRHKKDDTYKATRSKAPDELKTQIGIIQDVVKIIGMPMLKQPGVEADDLMATAAVKAKELGNIQTVIVSGDMDILQMVDKNIEFYIPKRGIKEVKHIYPENFEEEYNMKPYQVVDFKGLAGDSSDNLKGVEGVGKKTALKLLETYDTLENVYEHIDEIKGKLQERLIRDKDNAFHCKEMATLKRDCDIDFSREMMSIDHIDYGKMKSVFETYELYSLINRIQAWVTGDNSGEMSQMAQDVFGTTEKKKNSKKASDDQMSMF